MRKEKGVEAEIATTPLKLGGPAWDRTRDPLIMSQML